MVVQPGPRQHAETPRNPQSGNAPEHRTDFERDRDRILYSSAFRRLDGVTQVGAAHERFLLHNRLTHSLKVAQIGRRLAQRLTDSRYGNPDLKPFIDPDVVETAGLAHDIGHPPFGHSAEVVLDGRLEDAGGFEGNAQSFHIVVRLAGRNGLNLTHRSLAAILKYPCFKHQLEDVVAKRQLDGVEHWTDRSFGSKWGAYRSENSAFAFARQAHVDSNTSFKYQRGPEAIIMDWADDVSFATHDIDDYYRAGLIPLHYLERDLEDLIRFGTNKMQKLPGFKAVALQAAFQKIANASFIAGPFRDDPNGREQIHSFTDTFLSLLLGGVSMQSSFPYVSVTDDAQYLAEALKTLTRYYVIDSPATAIAREGQTHMVGNLFDQLSEWTIKDPQSPKLPHALRSLYAVSLEDEEVRSSVAYNESSLARQTVADYLCTLTESQTMDMAQRFAGSAPASMFGSWF